MSLRHISLRDFVIVHRLELDLADGFCVLTGETGAGKSILVDALQLALGARADALVVREGAARADGKGPSIWDRFCVVPRPRQVPQGSVTTWPEPSQAGQGRVIVLGDQYAHRPSAMPAGAARSLCPTPGTLRRAPGTAAHSSAEVQDFVRIFH